VISLERGILALGVIIGVLLAAPNATTVSSQTPAPGIQVFVGYADNVRSDPVNFPTPWNGSPNVTFEGCPSDCTFDGGAVMLLNNTAKQVTVNSVEIDVDTCRINLWRSDIPLLPGANLIVTQVTSGETPGCAGIESGQMDTSDIGPGGTSYADICTPNGIVPMLKLIIDGNPSEIPDKGQVLNTGGLDKGACPPGTNESTQWTAIGSVACPGAVLSLAPDSGTGSGDSTPTVHATLTNECGTPLPNVRVDFLLASGPNAGLKGAGDTDSSGIAAFAYKSSAAGTDVVKASVTNPAGTFNSKNDLSLQVGRPGEGNSLLLPLFAGLAIAVLALGGGLLFWRRRLAPAGEVALPARRPGSPAAVISGGPFPPPAVKADAWLEVSDGGDRYPLQDEPVTVGFTGDCSINLARGETFGPERVRIWRREGAYMLHKLSRFGTVTVSGKPAAAWIVLEDGDEIVLGDRRLIFHAGPPPGSD
jgi:hypothetical protein